MSRAASTEFPKPLVSILIPAHNSQRWIADTLRSAIAQTYEPKEIIVVDDGSSDRTVEVAKQFESDRVHVVRQKQQGAAAARNHALSISRGDYIQWLDADDLLSPDKIQLQMDAQRLASNPRVLLSSGYGRFIYRDSQARFNPTALWTDLQPIEWLILKMGQNLFMQTATWLVSRELTQAAGPWDTRLLSDDDGEYFCRVLMASEGVKFVPGAKVYYRGPGVVFQGLSHVGQSSRKIEAHWLAMQLHMDYLRSMEDSPRVREACVNFLRTSQMYFYPDHLNIAKRAEELAHELGGQIDVPKFSWKYAWIEKLFGWKVAKNCQQFLLNLRWKLTGRMDHALLRLERTTAKLRDTTIQFATRIQNRLLRMTAKNLARRPFEVKSEVPIISFSFDDFPKSALNTGGRILKSYGVAGTYYASLGLMGSTAPTGKIFQPEDLRLLVEQGHELGCHTFHHTHASETQPDVFENEVLENRKALAALLPGARFETHSYPIGVPRPGTKRRIQKYFSCCRCAGQTFNAGTADLNYLSAFFIEKSRDNPDAIKKVIDQNRDARGWLIFATHDVAQDPTRYGCTPELFEEVVRYAVESGAVILPVYQALAKFKSTGN